MNSFKALFRKLDRKFFFEVVSKWAALTLLLLCICIVLRGYMIFRLSIAVGCSVEQSLTILSGLYFDLLFVAKVSLLALLPFLAVALFSINIAAIVYSSAIGLYSLIYVCLIEYFINVKVPLDHVLLTYSLHDIKEIVLASTSISIWFYIGLGLFVALFALLVWLSKRVKVARWCAVTLLGVILSANVAFNYKSVLYNELTYATTSQYNLAVNHFSYAFHKIKDCKFALSHSLSRDELLREIRSFQALYPQKNFTDESYPFMHQVSNDDVLGAFLKKSSDSLPPNIVVIVIEGWGKELSDVPYPVLSFTPFLDSLAKESLFWKNCLATTERTFGVLPALFASAPFGEKGFANVFVPVPYHHSIFVDAAHNGYQNSFYYGGCAAFNGQDRFLKNNGVHYIMDVNVDSLQKYNTQEFKDFNRWGIDDREMFQMAFSHREHDGITRPRLEVYQTLTTHEPFVFKGCETYIRKVKEMEREAADELKKQPVEKDIIRRYPQIFASFLYVDDCVKSLFDYYRTQPDYENTIFLITGDHRIGGTIEDNPLRMYHVPLILYSPLLKRSKEMASVVSHWDVTPTLNAYLKSNYDYQISDWVPWVGQTLDTNDKFVSHQRIAFMRNNRDVIDYLNDNYLIVNQRVYKVLDDLQVEQVYDKKVQQRLVAERSAFAHISRYVSNIDYLMSPESQKRQRLCHYVWDFEKSVHAYFQNIVVPLAENNHCVMANQNHPYLPLMLPLILDDNYDCAFLDFSFDMKLSKRGRPVVNVIVEISDDKETAYYQFFDVYSETGQAVRPKQWQRCRFKTALLLKGIDVKGKSLKVVAYSQQGTLVQIDNLTAQVEVPKK